MSNCTLLASTADTGTTPNTSDAYAPTVGARQVIFVSAPDTVDNTLTVTNSESMTYTLVAVAERSAGAERLFCYVADSDTVSGASQTVTVDMPADPASGTVIFVYEVTAVSGAGVDCVRQFKVQSNQTVGSNPRPDITFDASCLTGNATIACIGNRTNPAGLDPPVGWTEPSSPVGDTGFASPNNGAQTCFRDSGFTGTLLDWASDSPSAWNGIAIELNAASVGTTISPNTAGMSV